RGAALPGNGDDLRHRPLAVGLDRLLDRLRVLVRQRPRRGVVGAALGTEDQEAAEPRPRVHRPRVAVVGILHLARQWQPLRDAVLAVTLQVRHLTPPFEAGLDSVTAVVGRKAALFRLSYRPTNRPGGGRTRDLPDVRPGALPITTSLRPAAVLTTMLGP